MTNVIEKAAAARKLLSCRLRRSLLFYKSDREDRSSSVTEYMRPGRSRTVNERRGPDGIVRTETIWIDKVKYVRVDEGSWSIVRPANATVTEQREGVTPGTFVNRSVGAQQKTEREFKYLGQKKLGERSMELYQAVKKTIFGGGSLSMITTSKYWFDDQGLLVKETEESQFSTGKKMYSAIDEYEYDPSIKIESPIP